MNNLKVENPLYAYVTAFIDELARSGVQNVVVCPGSRSTPLAYGFAANSAIKLWMEYDERAAGFFALGMAKASRHPVALVCTSGTAAANFMPAVVEAYHSRIPLLVLTADRPHELRDNGAPQAIDQLRLYGSYAKWFVEMALPEATNEMLRYARTIACRAAGTAAASPAGPVHLNMPFREPLTPAPIPGQPLPPVTERDPVAWSGRPDGQPYAKLQQAPRRLAMDDITKLADQLENIERGIIICGPQDDPALAEPIAKLAAQLSYPILADPLSQLRSGPHSRQPIISNYDAFLRDGRFTGSDEFKPEVVLRFGAMPTAKPLLLFLKKYPDCRQIVIDGGDGWNEPTLLAEQVIHTNPLNFCHDLAACLEYWPRPGDWLPNWLEVARCTATALQTRLDQMAASNELFEGRVLAEMTRLPDGATLFVGNSMPIRDLDSFFPGSDRALSVLCNRGANGIDGIISSALGAAAVSPGPLVLVLGDLSAYHDLNGLLAARLHQLNVTVIILNNDGGGIFSFLPQASYPDNFELLFGTPHGLDFASIVQGYGGNFRRTSSWPEFDTALEQALQTDGLKVIEVPTNRASNVTLHRQMWTAVYEALAPEAVSK
jgi:2-succinyl-5-enolpyruvyl-6-hydroxy-3-cyclohexene-1-carboxylate synthase